MVFKDTELMEEVSLELVREQILKIKYIYTQMKDHGMKEMMQVILKLVVLEKMQMEKQ